MSQISTDKIMKLILLSFLSLSLFTSCAKEPAGVRATVKTQQTNLNPAVSAQADQQAAGAKADYKISTIAIPTQTAAGFSVDVELSTPSGERLPLTTRHENGNIDSEGVYNDTARSLQVHVMARCSQDNCTKYTVIVTTIRNNQAIYQATAISYKDDCKFHSVSASFNVGEFLKSLNEVDNKYSVSPKNDIESCSN